MTGLVIPGEVIIGLSSAQIAAIVALFIALVRTRDRVTRLEALDEADQRHRDNYEW